MVHFVYNVHNRFQYNDFEDRKWLLHPRFSQNTISNKIMDLIIVLIVMEMYHYNNNLVHHHLSLLHSIIKDHVVVFFHHHDKIQYSNIDNELLIIEYW